jgi:hypothetical protein
VAIIGAVLVATLTTGATDRLESAGVPAATTTGLVDAATSSAGASIAVLRAQQGEQSTTVLALEHAYVSSTRAVGLVAAGFLLIGLLASLSLGRGDDTGRAAVAPSEGEAAGAAPAV